MDKILENVQVEEVLLSFLESGGTLKDPQALEKFLAHGLPDVKNEDWKYTNIRGLLRSLELNPRVDFDPYAVRLELPFQQETFETIVLVNGQLVQSSLSEGIQVEMLDMFPAASEDVLSNLNMAFSDRIVHIHFSRVIEKPVLLYHYLDPAESGFLQTRMVFSSAPGASAQVFNVQHKVGEADFFHNQWVDLQVAPNAAIRLYRIQEEQKGFNQFSNVTATCRKDASFQMFTATLGGGLIRNNYTVRLSEPGAYASLSGLNILNGKSHADTCIRVIHEAPHCDSNQLFKNIVADQATIIFNGKIFVAKEAQKTNAYQSNRNIVLSGEANAYSKPQLEIYADDVKCSHGSTTGKLNEDALFYLRARGIREASARTLLMEAFLMDVVEKLEDGPWKNSLAEMIQQGLRKMIRV